MLNSKLPRRSGWLSEYQPTKLTVHAGAQLGNGAFNGVQSVGQLLGDAFQPSHGGAPRGIFSHKKAPTVATRVPKDSAVRAFHY